MDYMKCEENYNNEDFTNFSLDCVQETNYNEMTNNHLCNRDNYNITQYNHEIYNIPSNKIKIFNTNIQRKKRYIPKFTIGYRSDCKKCRDGVPNHYGHINYE